MESPSELALDGHALGKLTGAKGKALGSLFKTLLLEVDRDPSLNTVEALSARARALGTTPS